MRLDPGRHESLTRGVGSRLGIPEYAMALAHVASLRSEDPYRKVGAAAARVFTQKKKIVQEVCVQR